MGGIVSSVYNLLYGQKLSSLTLLDIPGMWSLQPQVHEMGMKMAIMADIEGTGFSKISIQKVYFKWTLKTQAGKFQLVKDAILPINPKKGSPIFSRRPKARTWDEWIEIVNKTRNDSTEYDQGFYFIKFNASDGLYPSTRKSK